MEGRVSVKMVWTFLLEWAVDIFSPDKSGTLQMFIKLMCLSYLVLTVVHTCIPCTTIIVYEQ